MIPITSFAGKTVAVFGLGGSGLASCRALKSGGARVIAGDDPTSTSSSGGSRSRASMKAVSRAWPSSTTRSPPGSVVTRTVRPAAMRSRLAH